MSLLGEVTEPMVMTRPTDGGAATDVREPRPRRVVTRAPGVPGSRAVVGGLLVALAGVGTFVSWQQASGTPEHAYAVADRTLQPGEPVTADAVRFERIDLPADVAGAAFVTPADLEGRVLVAPVGEGELLQQGALSDQGQPDPAAEVSVALARDLAVDGRLRTGDLVDVYATHDEDTSAVAEGVRVISVTEGSGSFADGSELTVTLALASAEQRIPVIHAARAGQITLVRTTHVARGAAPSTSSDDAPAGTPSTTTGEAPAGTPSTTTGEAPAGTPSAGGA
jgi:Flp pilus assembly protein CpaB